MKAAPRQCKICKKPIVGRHDKIFCSINCKNDYHVQLRRATAQAVKTTDKILHRNRSVLLEVMGKNARQKKVDRQVLDAKKFNWKYFTGTYINSKEKLYHIIYDFAWMEFTDGEILIVKRNM
jgi:uncharacterized Zn finger protein (UPF0148 family)